MNVINWAFSALDLSGGLNSSALDVLIVQHDEILSSTPFHVSFNIGNSRSWSKSFHEMSNNDKIIKIRVNGDDIETLFMLIGASGETYFIEPTKKDQSESQPNQSRKRTNSGINPSFITPKKGNRRRSHSLPDFPSTPDHIQLLQSNRQDISTPEPAVNSKNIDNLPPIFDDFSRNVDATFLREESVGSQLDQFFDAYPLDDQSNDSDHEKKEEIEDGYSFHPLDDDLNVDTKSKTMMEENDVKEVITPPKQVTFKLDKNKDKQSHEKMENDLRLMIRREISVTNLDDFEECIEFRESNEDLGNITELDNNNMSNIPSNSSIEEEFNVLMQFHDLTNTPILSVCGQEYIPDLKANENNDHIPFSFKKDFLSGVIDHSIFSSNITFLLSLTNSTDKYTSTPSLVLLIDHEFLSWFEGLPRLLSRILFNKNLNENSKIKLSEHPLHQKQIIEEPVKIKSLILGKDLKEIDNKSDIDNSNNNDQDQDAINDKSLKKNNSASKSFWNRIFSKKKNSNNNKTETMNKDGNKTRKDQNIIDSISKKVEMEGRKKGILRTESDLNIQSLIEDEIRIASKEPQIESIPEADEKLPLLNIETISGEDIDPEAPSMDISSPFQYNDEIESKTDEKLGTSTIKSPQHLNDAISPNSKEIAQLMEADKIITNDSIDLNNTDDKSKSNAQRKNKVHRDYNYRKTLIPTSEQLKSLNLNAGENKIEYIFKNGNNEIIVEGKIFLWSSDSRIVLSDLEGLNHRNNQAKIGVLSSISGNKSNQNTELLELFEGAINNGYKVLILTTHDISVVQKEREKLYESNPLFVNIPIFFLPSYIFSRRIEFNKKRDDWRNYFKESVLDWLRRLYPISKNPFYFGFSSKLSDLRIYQKAGVITRKTFLVDYEGGIIAGKGLRKSYKETKKELDYMFPPFIDSLNNDRVNNYVRQDQVTQGYNDLQFWNMPRVKVDLDDLK